MALVVATAGKDLPGLYSKANLLVAGFDAGMFWLNGNSFSNLFAWILFGLDVLRFGLAYVLFTGVRERSLFKCKTYCICEAILIVFTLLSIVIRILTIAGVVWLGIVVALRACGIKIIGGLVRILQNEIGQGANFPWTYFAEPVQMQNHARNVEFEASPV